MRRGSISSELPMCGEGMHSILLLPLVGRCLEAIDVCIWRMFVFMSVVVKLWGLWEVCRVEAVFKDSVFKIFGVLYVCVRDVMDVVSSVCIVMRGDIGARVWEV